MHDLKNKSVLALAAMLVVVVVTLASIPAAGAGDANRSPASPSAFFSSLQTPENRAPMRVYPLGGQILRWNGNVWEFMAELAILFADLNYYGEPSNPRSDI
jgi:hypothetical protein